MSDSRFIRPDRLSVSTIRTQQDMAQAVFDRYDTNHPIGIAKVKRGPQDKNDTFVLLLSGTEPVNFGQATTLPQDVAASLNQNDRYRQSIFNALEDAGVKKSDNLIIAGHSLGGMEAQNLVADKRFQANYHATEVVTFGSPKTWHEQPGVHYTRFQTKGDPVPLLSPGEAIGFDRPHQIQLHDNVIRDPIGQHLAYPRMDQLKQHPAPHGQLQLEPGSLKVFPAYQSKEIGDGMRGVNKAIENLEQRRQAQGAPQPDRRREMLESMRKQSGRETTPEPAPSKNGGSPSPKR